MMTIPASGCNSCSGSTVPPAARSLPARITTVNTLLESRNAGLEVSCAAMPHHQQLALEDAELAIAMLASKLI
jgi:hypothetical protein